MRKQTVEERYIQQQIMSGEIPAEQSTPYKKGKGEEVVKLLNQTEQALRQAYQSVLQAELAFPSLKHLQYAKERLQYVTDQLLRLGTIKPELIVGFSKNSVQQLSKLENEIKRASETLKLIQSTESIS